MSVGGFSGWGGVIYTIWLSLPTLPILMNQANEHPHHSVQMSGVNIANARLDSLTGVIRRYDLSTQYTYRVRLVTSTIRSCNTFGVRAGETTYVESLLDYS